MGCESSRQDKPNDSIRFNENVLKFRSKSVAAISEVANVQLDLSKYSMR